MSPRMSRAPVTSHIPSGVSPLVSNCCHFGCRGVGGGCFGCVCVCFLGLGQFHAKLCVVRVGVLAFASGQIFVTLPLRWGRCGCARQPGVVGGAWGASVGLRSRGSLS
eukprot:10997502-Alexandrium_andersonii.AAC.1